MLVWAVLESNNDNNNNKAKTIIGGGGEITAKKIFTQCDKELSSNYHLSTKDINSVRMIIAPSYLPRDLTSEGCYMD